MTRCDWGLCPGGAAEMQEIEFGQRFHSECLEQANELAELENDHA